MRSKKIINTEEKILVYALACTVVFTFIDVVQDLKSGSDISHVLFEVFAFLGGVYGLRVVLLRIFSAYQERIKVSETDISELKNQNKQFKKESEAILLGLSQQIDNQFENWEMSNAEKEIGMFLIKGLSAKEIADIRNVKEKTVRQQCLSIYKKSKLSGRAELSAFFLEDILLPSSISES